MTSSITSSACPHLGMRDDPGAFYSYPSSSNRCFRCKRPVTPELAHQEACCLMGGQKDCAAYMQAEGKAFPRELTSAPHRGSATALWTMLGLTILAAGIGFLAWWFVPRLMAGVMQVPFAGGPAPVTEAIQPTVTEPAVATNSPSARPTTTFAPTPIPSPERYALDVPFQVEGVQLVLHRVTAGDMFDTLDAQYDTTSEVIRALNASIREMLLANTVIVIAPGLKAVNAALPSFKVHHVDEPNATLEHVAREYRVDPALLRRYNPCTGACAFAAGDWVLIPITSK